MVGELLRHVPIHVFEVGGTDFTLFLAIRLQPYLQLNVKIVRLAARQVGQYLGLLCRSRYTKRFQSLHGHYPSRDRRTEIFS